MDNVTQSVPCARCGRSMLVTLSLLHPPCFQRVDEQAECPEIRERWNVKGEGGLLLMMCSALIRSLEVECEMAEVEATAENHEWRIACRMPGAPSASYSIEEARSRARIFEVHGHKKLAAGLRASAARAERRQSGRGRAVIGGIGAIAAAAAASWFLLVREPRTVPAEALRPVASSDVQSDAGVADRHPPANLAQAPPPTQPGPAIPKGAAQVQAPSLPETAAASDAVPGADVTPAAEQKPRLPEMALLPGGTFTMGGVDASELPVHQVTIKPFALGKWPVTVGDWKECVSAKACADVAAAGPDDNPITNVSYSDAQEYLAWLSRVAGKPYRLPSEAEWEYAARGGQRTTFWWGDQMRAGMADCKGCNAADDTPHPLKVGSFQANPFGLFDMGGCVDQWVADSWHRNYQGAPADGSAWVDQEGFARVIRSGSWENDPSYVRPASRDHYDARIRYPTHGFRVALSL